MKWSVINIGYRTDIRMVIPIEALPTMIDLASEYENEYGFNIVQLMDKHQPLKNKCSYICWDNASLKERDVIDDLCNDFGDKNIIYRISKIGENYEDIENFNSTYTQEDEERLPYIEITRGFDDKCFMRENKIENSEELEM